MCITTDLHAYTLTVLLMEVPLVPTVCAKWRKGRERIIKHSGYFPFSFDLADCVIVEKVI